VRDPRVVALRGRVNIKPDASLRKIQARIAIRLNNGTTLSTFVEHALGTLQRPMSDADLETKFRALTDGILSDAQSGELIRLCWSAATLPDAGEIARCAQPT